MHNVVHTTRMRTFHEKIRAALSKYDLLTRSRVARFVFKPGFAEVGIVVCRGVSFSTLKLHATFFQAMAQFMNITVAGG